MGRNFYSLFSLLTPFTKGSDSARGTVRGIRFLTKSRSSAREANTTADNCGRKRGRKVRE